MATPTYILGIINAITENGKAYRQEITFLERGPFKQAITTFPINAPEGLAGKTIEGNKLPGVNYLEDYNDLVSTIILESKSAFTGVGIVVDLEIINILNPPPSTPPKPIKPKPTPEEIESKRLQEAEQRANQQASIQDTDKKNIENSTPNNAKPQGSAKLPQLITAIGKKISIVLIPLALSLAIELGASISKDIQTKFKKKINPNNLCPNKAKLQELILKRNNLVKQLNNINIQLDRLTKTLIGLTTFLSLSLAALSVLKTTNKVLSLGVKFIPSPPGTPGAIVSVINDINTFINDKLFTDTGEAKLAKITGIIAGASLSISLVNISILAIINILKSIDAKLLECDKFATLDPIAPELISIANLQEQANLTTNNTTYKGFVLEIEIVPYTPTVNRRRAIGKNQNGIVLISTELSFTTFNEVLINELKLIIDRDNLKAY